MTENKSAKKGPANWSTRAGTIKEGSVQPIEGKEALRALVVNKEGAESIVEAYGDKAKAKLMAAAESGKPHIFRGDFYMKEKVSHLLISHVAEQGAPKASASAEKPEMTEAEKAERAAAREASKAARDASRVLVDSGSVEIGGTVEKDGVKHEVNHIGATYERDGKSVAYAYFGEVGAEMAARAAEEAKAPEAEEDASPAP